MHLYTTFICYFYKIVPTVAKPCVLLLEIRLAFTYICPRLRCPTNIGRALDVRVILSGKTAVGHQSKLVCFNWWLKTKFKTAKIKYEVWALRTKISKGFCQTQSNKIENEKSNLFLGYTYLLFRKFKVFLKSVDNYYHINMINENSCQRRSAGYWRNRQTQCFLTDGIFVFILY